MGLDVAGFGTLVGGFGSTIPSAIAGGVFGGTFGLAAGTTRAYVVPFFKRRSLGWSMRRASKALSRLERDPGNTTLLNKATQQLGKVRKKADGLARLGRGQSNRYYKLQQRAGAISPLSRMAGGL